MNKTAIRSRTLIVSAFMELIREKSVSAVTVKDIVERAGVNRSTFYAHFNSLEDLILSIFNEMTAELAEYMDKATPDDIKNNPLPLLLIIADFLEQRRDFYRAIIEMRGFEWFSENVRTMIITRLLEVSDASKSEHSEIRLRILSGGIMSTYRDWIMGRIDMSIYDLSAVMSEMITEEFAAETDGKNDNV